MNITKLLDAGYYAGIQVWNAYCSSASTNGVRCVNMYVFYVMIDANGNLTAQGFQHANNARVAHVYVVHMMIYTICEYQGANVAPCKPAATTVSYFCFALCGISVLQDL